ncbi:MAG TPA: hypothetical protein VMZ27_06805 [Candidatus Saccharimonadales bacterium]|nr:hypothetical protein [Candidatus Saccharimonadales bacterium]
MKIWSRLALSIVVLALFGFFALRALEKSSFLKARQNHVAICLAGAGALLWLIHKVHNRPVEGQDGKFLVSPFYARASYWGTLMMVCGGFVAGQEKGFQYVRSSEAKSRLMSAENWVKNLPALSKVHARGAKTNSSPSLKMQGICYSPAKSTAIINGQTVGVGDHIAGAKVLAITASGVTIQMSGETRTLAMH